ncbi:hypothetical protein C882_2511 [Caenispirillum salinarum AK4]|uniref:Uncharacterized protein n=1 Tax=Caenispirillum salinarum AK4 TaxID=1238182 RepID=K9H4D0_9PROT|nr:hypothetical protein [Caenispirillum salinarum]EKV32432.1 hypothetical protein C882_2511 [Caenispirillum salinarum AK4]
MTTPAPDALPFTVELPILAAVLVHNHAIRKAFAAVLPSETVVREWFDLTEALGADDRCGRLVADWKGNKSESLVLACVLMKADFAGRADALMPRVFTTWDGLDARNKAMVLDMLEGVDDTDAVEGPAV